MSACGCSPDEISSRTARLFVNESKLKVDGSSHNGSATKGRGVFAGRKFEPGESVLLEDIAVQHIFTDPADYSQDAGIEEGVREFLSRGVEWCQRSSKQSSKTKKKKQTKQMKKEKVIARLQLATRGGPRRWKTLCCQGSEKKNQAREPLRAGVLPVTQEALRIDAGEGDRPEQRGQNPLL